MRKLDIFQNLRRKAPLEIALYCVVSLIFSAVALSYLYLLVWGILAGFKTHSEIVLNPFSLPTTWHWENYIDLTQLLKVGDHTFWEMLLNSIIFSVVGSFANLFIVMQFSYAYARYEFPFKKWIFPLILTVMSLPLYGTSGGLYKVYHDLGFIDSYAQLLAIGAVTHTGTLYFVAFFQNMSWSYAEAAMMDGANHFDIYYRVMMPQAKPIFVAQFILNWMGSWNDYSATMIYRPNLPNLAYGIYQFNTEMTFQARFDILYASCVVASIPAIALFIVFNKQLTTSMSLGGLKG